MIFRGTIAADQPARVAGVVAELWGGVAMPFERIGAGAWIAITDDNRHAAIEVRQRVAGEPQAGGGFLALATPLSSYQVAHIAHCQGWTVRQGMRSGRFAVIELWIENGTMIEVLTPPMQRDYLDALNAELWSDRRVAA